VGELSFDLLLVLAAAFAAGLIDAMVGGGGLIQIPALFAVYPNVAPATLLGTSGRKISAETTLASRAPPTDNASASKASGRRARHGMTTLRA
jgi:hypothetical protein